MISTRRALVRLAAAAMLTGALVPGYSQDKSPVVLGFVTPVTSSWGKDVMRGVDLAVKQVNAAGGINQRPVKVITYDDLNKPEEGVAAVERLIARDNAKLILGSFSSSGSMAQQAVTERYKKVHVLSFPQADSVRDASHAMAFFMNATVGMTLTKYLEYAAKELKPRKVVIMADTSDYGQASADTVKRIWSKPQDPQVMAVERYDQKQADLSPQLTKIRSLAPDAVFIAGGSGEAVANVLTQMRELRVPGARLTVPGILSEGFLKVAGKSAEGLINGDFYFYDNDNPANKAFVQAFQTDYKYNPSKLEMIGFETVDLAVQLLKKAGPDATDEVLAKTLRETTWTTPRGTWKFVPMGKAYQAEAGFTLLTVKDGKVVKLR